MTNIRSVLVELGTPRQFVTPSNEGRFTVNKLLFAAAALLAASTAPMAHAVDFNVSGVFGSNTGSYSSVETAIQTYAMAPTNANYEAILGLITSTGLGTTLSVSDSVSALTPTLETQAGGIHLTNNAQFTASGIVLTEYVDSVFSFNYGSIGIFIADAGSSYNFSGNIGVSGGSYSTLGTVFRSNYSTLMFNNATFSNNDGVLGMGGAINSFSAGDWMTFTNVTFTRNTSGNGGAIYKTDGRMAIAKSLFSANGSRQNEGGAISNNSGPLTIVDTSFRQNVASGIGSTGGAIATAEGTTIATNTIFSGNQVTGKNSRGGAILIYYGTVDFT
ncbi:MAG: hypothetical protein LBV28_03555, partial [Puniceicoccales bacterium]|nr:hypothetical protein [Puniceicoccales bacterium]